MEAYNFLHRNSIFRIALIENGARPHIQISFIIAHYCDISPDRFQYSFLMSWQKPELLLAISAKHTLHKKEWMEQNYIEFVDLL